MICVTMHGLIHWYWYSVCLVRAHISTSFLHAGSDRPRLPIFDNPDVDKLLTLIKKPSNTERACHAITAV